MPEVFWNHDRYIENIDVKWDKTPDWFNEKQIKEKARNYFEKRISEWISPEDYQTLLQEIKTLLERQDIERLNLTEELEWKIIQETREELDKEALIQQAKTILYEKLWIDENQAQNSKTENFLKWIVDVLVIDNYDLAIQIWQTNGKVVIDALKTLMSWDWLKQIAQALWESFVSLFSWNAYEKWKAVWELWLVATWIWVTAVVWRKAFKVWMKEIAKHTAKKETLVNTPEIKWVISETNKKIEDIVPKKEVDFEKKLQENIVKIWEKENEWERKSKDLTPEKESVISEQRNIDDNLTTLRMEKWPSLNSLYSDSKYSFLEKYKEVLWENLSLDDVVWEWTQAIIIKHPTNEKLVIKIAKPWDVDDIMKEFHNHNLFYEKWLDLSLDWKIDKKIRVPQLLKWEVDWYFYMEKVDWQSLYSKTLIERYEKQLTSEELKTIWELDDKQVREVLKKRFNESDSYLDQIIEDYSGDFLADALWTSYKHRKETWKIWWTPLDHAIKILRENWIAHNDLHPWNIMIDRNWNTYIIDFWRIKEFNK